MYVRAACICKTCVLPGSGGLNLHVVAMALSGYYDNKNTLWQEMCQSLYSRLDDAYLRAMFAFLTCEDDKYDSVLVRTLAPNPPPQLMYLLLITHAPAARAGYNSTANNGLVVC